MRPSLLPIVFMLLALALPATGAHAAPADSPLDAVASFGANPGKLRMYKYIPSEFGANRPLVVALHGCRQDAAKYGVGAGWLGLSEKWKFAVLMPEQTASNNKERCFRWWNGENILDILAWGSDIDRDKGEAASIRNMIEKMVQDHRIDRSRIFVTGLSAGGAMTAVMMATYPEVFSAGAVLAGIPYKCTTATSEAVAPCMKVGKNRTPKEWGDLVRAAAPNYKGPWPRVSIWQGETDQLVNPNNAEQLVKQWANVNAIDLVPAKDETVKGHFHRTYADKQGRAVVDYWLIRGAGHGTPVDPGPGEEQCGSPLPFLLDRPKICSSYYIGKFWGLDASPAR